MKKQIIFVVLMLFTVVNHAQEKKRMWAKSFINQKAPELVIEKWINEPPEVEGKFVLLDFWATWCAPCRKVIPELNNYQKQFKDHLVVVGLSNEPFSKLKSYNATLSYSHATDTQRRTYMRYNIRGIPHTVLIDPEGIVRWEGYPLLSGYRLTEDIIRDIINTYYQK